MRVFGQFVKSSIKKPINRQATDPRRLQIISACVFNLLIATRE